MKKQFIAKMLVLVMILAMIPVTALAADSVVSGVRAGSPSGSAEEDFSNDTTVISNSSTTTTTTTSSSSSSVTNVGANDIAISGSTGTIEATVVNGTATVSLNGDAVKSLASLAAGGNISLVINDQGATKLNVSFPAAALSALAKETGAALTIQSSVATISIPNSVLTSEIGNVGNVTVSAQATKVSVGFSIKVGGRALNGLKGVEVSF